MTHLKGTPGGLPALVTVRRLPPAILVGLLLLGPIAWAVDANPESTPPASGGSPEGGFLGRTRQLTFEGRRAGEGYFSSDGSRMVFQSERSADNPFYQIYELDLQTGETRKISPGTGKTTCAFFQPGSRNIEFASTHADPASVAHQRSELEFRASGKKRRYSWDFDPEMEIYLAEPGGKTPIRLTHTRGYDAEGSFSPDGKWIVFSSTRQAYDRELGAEERKQLEMDPSFFAELYVMRADGSDLRRLTDTPGYDGGPFFSPDGRRIVWRRFDPNGLVADVWTMDFDGTDERRLTTFGSMSWAPYPHPSGKYIIFTSNKLGFDNFELFIVDTDGLKEPVRVTYTDGFDGLPVPSPDGERLAWTSTRNGNDTGGQIFLAEWNHSAALEALRDAPPRQTSPAAPGPAIEPEWDTGSIVSRLREIGAVPLADRDRFDVRLEYRVGVSDAGSRLGIGDRSRIVRGMPFSDDGEVSAPVVFAGYGLSVPAEDGYSYDSYAGLDVEGKIVLVVADLPKELPPDHAAKVARYSEARHRAVVAREKGAKAVLFLGAPDPETPAGVAGTFVAEAVAIPGFLAALVDEQVCRELFDRAGTDLDDVRARVRGGGPGVELAGGPVTLGVARVRESRTTRAIAGVLPAGVATDARTGENLVAVVAGPGPAGGPAALAAGSWLSSRSRQRPVVLVFTPPTSRVRVATTAAVRAIRGRVSAALVLEGVSDEGGTLPIAGSGTSPVWPKLIEQANVVAGFDLRLHGSPAPGGVSHALYEAGIPVLELGRLPAGESLVPASEGVEEVGRFAGLIARKLSLAADDPGFERVLAEPARGAAGSERAHTGTVPDYASVVEGMRLAGVVPDGPADRAGLREGDVIVELAGRPIGDAYDYSDALNDLTAGRRVGVTFLRDGRRMETEIVPTAR